MKGEVGGTLGQLSGSPRPLGQRSQASFLYYLLSCLRCIYRVPATVQTPSFLDHLRYARPQAWASKMDTLRTSGACRGPGDTDSKAQVGSGRPGNPTSGLSQRPGQWGLGDLSCSLEIEPVGKKARGSFQSKDICPSLGSSTMGQPPGTVRLSCSIRELETSTLFY